MNPIEQIWKYIRKQIRKRRLTGEYPKNEKEMWVAWEEEWVKVLQEVINMWIERMDDVCGKIIKYKGDNCFHG